MTEFLTAILGLILALLALGLVRVLRGPGEADRMMAAQLIGTAGIASLLLLGAVTDVPATVDVALTVALLATFASIAFVKKGSASMVTITAVSAGALFFLAGTVGLLRFPDALTRLHALTKADNLGLGLVVLGLLPQAGSLRDGLKLVCVWLLVLLAGATVSQLIARAALASDQRGESL
jgi:multicomponent Na+:H+ antiporter subunit G